MDRFPTRNFRVACNQIRETSRPAPGQLEDNAAIIRAIHIVDVRGEKFEVEFIRETAEMTAGKRVEAHRHLPQRTRCQTARFHFAINQGEDVFSLGAVLEIFRVHDPIRSILPKNDRRAVHITVVVVEAGKDQTLHEVIFQGFREYRPNVCNRRIAQRRNA